MASPDATVDGVRRALERGRATLKFAGRDEPYRVRPVPDSACHVACPAAVNVKAYVGLVGAGEFARALEVVREQNPLPGICGRVCTHPCEAECRRAEVDAPVAIRLLKRFIADYALNAPPARLPPGTPRREARVAVIGSGPAGLACANDLVRRGWQVTLFEALPRPGGMLRVGIPRFRLPHDIIDHEVASIAGLGVRIETGARISNPAELLVRDFAAVFCAIGAHRDLSLGLELEDELPGVVNCLEFLRRANLGPVEPVEGRVLVIGGGNSAIDAARTARRLGAREVRILYRRTRKEMPADPHEIDEAIAEGVRIDFRVQPVALLHRDGRLAGLRLIRNRLGRPDESGRRRPEPIPGSEFDLPARVVIKAIGQRPVTEGFDRAGLALTRQGTIVADPQSGRTGASGLFAGGDVVTGPSTVIDAIAAGHRAARAMHAFLAGLPDEETAPAPAFEPELVIPTLTAVPAERVRPGMAPLRQRRTFNEVEQPLSEAAAVAEAGRCLRCGPCNECVHCHARCPRRQVSLHLPGAHHDIVLRIPSLDTLFPDPASALEVTVTRPGARPVTMTAGPVIAHVNPELCRGCGQCVAACVHEAIRLVPWHRELEVASVDPDRCRGCGICLAACPSGALTDHRPEPAKNG